jgi:hypothetical protein
MRNCVAAIVLIALAGCDGGSAPAPVRKIEIARNDAYIAKLRALTPQARSLTLRRGVQDAGRPCRRVIGSAETGTHENMSVWTLRCDGGNDYAVFIAPGGEVQARDCEQTVQLGLPACTLDAVKDEG